MIRARDAARTTLARCVLRVRVLFFNRGLLRAAHKREERERGSEFFEGAQSGGRQSDELSSVRREEIIELIADNLGRPTKYSKVNNANAGGEGDLRGGRGAEGRAQVVPRRQSSARRVFPLFQRRVSLPPSLSLSLFLSRSLSFSLDSPDRNMRSRSRAAGRKARTLNWTKPQPSLARATHSASVAICQKKKKKRKKKEKGRRKKYESLLAESGSARVRGQCAGQGGEKERSTRSKSEISNGIKSSPSPSLSLLSLEDRTGGGFNVPPPTGSRPSRPENLLRDEAQSRNPAKIPHGKILHEIPRQRLRVDREEASLVTKETATRRRRGRARYGRQQGVERRLSLQIFRPAPVAPAFLVESPLESWLTIKILYLHCRQPRRLILMFFLRRISCAGNYQRKQPARGGRKKERGERAVMKGVRATATMFAPPRAKGIALSINSSHRGVIKQLRSSVFLFFAEWRIER